MDNFDFHGYYHRRKALIDAALEPDETISLTLNPGAGYTPGVFNAAVGTIQTCETPLRFDT